MSDTKDTLVVDGTTYTISRVRRGPCEGDPFGLFITGGEDLSGVAFLSKAEALALRDHITRHLDPTA